MLRVKRSVETAYSQVNYLANDLLAASSAEQTKKPSEALPMDAFKRAESEREAQLLEDAEPAAKRLALSSGRSSNPDEINIDEGGDDGLELKQKPVPAAVYGSVVSAK